MTDIETIRMVLGIAAVLAGRGRLWHDSDHCALCGASVTEPRLAHERRHGEQYALPVLRARAGLIGAALAVAVGERYRELLRVAHADVALEEARQEREASERTLEMSRHLSSQAAAEVEQARQYEREAHAARQSAEEQLERERGALGAQLLALPRERRMPDAEPVQRDRFELLDL